MKVGDTVCKGCGYFEDAPVTARSLIHEGYIVYQVLTINVACCVEANLIIILARTYVPGHGMYVQLVQVPVANRGDNQTTLQSKE